MGDRALSAASEDTEDVTRRDEASHETSPATRLLDALRVGDHDGVLAQCGESTVVTADVMSWSCRGRHEIQRMLTLSRERFPGLTFESRTRHVGFGLVIDEARVQDELFAEDETADDDGYTSGAEQAGSHAAPADPSVHPMYDEPVPAPSSARSLSKHRSGEPLPPIRLNMPVRVTVRHDDLQVHEVILSFPAALLKRALGLHVDPFEMSLSEVQSALIAPVGAGFRTYTLARRELKLVPPAPPVTEERPVDEEPPRRRGGRVLVPLLLALLAVLGGGTWYAVQGKDSGTQAGTNVTTHHPRTSPSPTPSPSSRATSTTAPTVTRGQPSNAPTRKPNVTLKSDLAFGFNSATLSPQAKLAIQHVAQQVKAAGLTGSIYVDGYTDNLGSASYGLVLSRRRADAVSHYLGSQLVGVSGISIVSIGHGEANPIADNSTAAGRQANRRVTITLPKP